MVYARETESSGLHPSFRRVCVDQDQFQTVFEKRDRTMKITGVRGVDGGDRWSKIAYRVAIATKKNSGTSSRFLPRFLISTRFLHPSVFTPTAYAGTVHGAPNLDQLQTVTLSANWKRGACT